MTDIKHPKITLSKPIILIKAVPSSNLGLYDEIDEPQSTRVQL